MFHAVGIIGGLSLLFAMMIVYMIGLGRELRTELRSEAAAKARKDALDESSQGTGAIPSVHVSEVGTTKQVSPPTPAARVV